MTAYLDYEAADRRVSELYEALFEALLDGTALPRLLDLNTALNAAWTRRDELLEDWKHDERGDACAS